MAPIKPRDSKQSAAAQEDAEQFHLLVDAVRDYAIFLLDADGRVKTWNAGAQRIKGWTENEIIGLHYETFFTDSDRASGLPIRILEQVAKTGHHHLTGMRVRKDGSVFTAAVTITAVKDKFGTLIGYAKVTRDITEQLQMSAQLEQEYAFRIMADNAAVLIWVSDTTKQCTYFNKPRLEFTGRTAAQEMGNGWTHEVHADDLQHYLNVYAASFDTREEFKMEYRLRRHDGVYRWLFDHGVPHFGPDGVFLGYIGSCVDITDRKESEQRLATLLHTLQIESHRTETIVASVPGVVWEAWGKPDAATQRINFVSDYAHTMLGYTKEEWLSTPNFWLTIVHPEDRERAAKNASDAFANGATHINEFRWITKDGRALWVESHSTVIMDDDGKSLGMRGVTFDVTQQRIFKEQLGARAAQHELVAALSRSALEGAELSVLVQQAVETIVPVLQVEYSSALELRDDGDLVVSTKVGWTTPPGEEILSGKRSQAGHSIVTGQPVIVADWNAETRFERTESLKRNGVISSLCVPIADIGNVWGVLGAYSTKNRQFTMADIHFLQTIANVLSSVLHRKDALRQLQLSEIRFRSLVDQSVLSTQIFSPSGKTIRVNRAWEQMWGSTFDDLESYNILEDKQLVERGVMPMIRMAFAGEPATIPPVMYIPPAGQYANRALWVSANIYPVKDEAGQIREVVLVHEDITERRRADEEVKRSRDQLDIILKGVHDAITALRPNGEIIYANDKAAKLIGLDTADELMSKEFLGISGGFDYFTPEGHPLPVEQLPSRIAMQGTPVHGHVLRYRSRQSGTEHWSIISSQPVFDAAGKVDFIINIFRDITEERLAEQSLRYQSEINKTLTENAVSCLFLLDDHGHPTFMNPAAELVTGYTLDEIKGKPLHESLHYLRPDGKEYLPHECPFMNAIINHQRMKGVRDMFLRKDGSFFPVSCAVSPLQQDGSTASAVLEFQDITEQVRAEEALLGSEERMRFLADISASFVKSMHYPQTLKTLARSVVPKLADWCVVDLLENQKIHRMAITHQDPQRELEAWEMERKYPANNEHIPEELNVMKTGKSYLFANVPEDLVLAGAQDDVHREFLRKANIRSVMVVPLKARGKMMGSITFIMTESGRVYDEDDLVLSEDLAHRAALAVDNARLYKRAQEALSLRDDFLSIASHELKTPVTSIKAFLQALAHRMKNPENFDFANNAQYMQLSIKQVDRLAIIINDLLDINRINKGTLEYHFTVAPLGPIIAEVIERMSVSFPSHHIACKLQDLTMKVKIDLVRFEQALTNLITNAVKYSPPQSTIDVVMRNDGRHVYLNIVDRGIGIPKEQQAHIFDAYYRAPGALSTRVGGLGIGLFVSSQLIKAHGGQLLVESEEGNGSTFTIKLPCKK